MSFEGLKGRVQTIPQVDKTLTQEGCYADAKVVGDRLKEIENQFEENAKVETINLWVEPNVNSIKNVCYKCGKVCTVVYDFTTNHEIPASGVPIFADLPKPKADYTFEVHSMNDGKPYWLGLYSSGHISTAYVNNIPGSTRLFGTFTYLAE